MTLKTKVNSIISYLKKGKRKREREEKRCSGYGFLVFRERVSNFSLGLRTIRPSKFFGARRKTALHGKGFAWVPYLRSFEKLREVLC